MLTKEGLVNISRRSTVVEIDGGSVRLLELTGTGRDEYDHFVSVLATKNNWRNVRAKLVSLCLVDENDAPLFGPDELQKVGDLAGGLLDKLFDECKTLNALDENPELTEKK